MQVNHKSLPQRTADTLLLMLHSENYLAGQKLPGEIELAKRFEVSRSTVREAIKILADDNILEVERGAGTFVSRKIAVADDPLGLSMIYDKQQLAKDLLQIRLMIEPRTAMLAAHCATPENIEALENICSRLEYEIMHGENYLNTDMEFHRAVANCSGNMVVHKIIPLIHQMQTLHESMTSHRQQMETAREHRAVVRAISCHDSAAASDAMQLHLLKISERL